MLLDPSTTTTMAMVAQPFGGSGGLPLPFTYCPILTPMRKSFSHRVMRKTLMRRTLKEELDEQDNGEEDVNQQADQEQHDRSQSNSQALDVEKTRTRSKKAKKTLYCPHGCVSRDGVMPATYCKGPNPYRHMRRKHNLAKRTPQQWRAELKQQFSAKRAIKRPSDSRAIKTSHRPSRTQSTAGFEQKPS